MKISRTPLRFSLIGGGSDLPAYWQHYGPCKIISMTLTASIYVTFTERNLYEGSAKDVYGNNIRISYTQTEHVDSIDEIKHDLIRESLGFVSDTFPADWIPPAFEITTIGDIPSKGAGLGTSSALIVGLLMAIFHVGGHTSIPMNFQEMASIEIDRLGRQIGYQDFMSAQMGALRCYTLGIDRFKSDHMHEVGDDLAERLVAFRLPLDRSDSAQSVPAHETLEDMQRQMEIRYPYLKQTVEMVDPMVDALTHRRWEEVGEILQEAWELKKASHGYVDKNVERWYSMGMEAGALAGKVSGSMSKGAGHLFFLAYPDDHDRIRETVGAELSEMQVDYYPHGSKVWEV